MMPSALRSCWNVTSSDWNAYSEPDTTPMALPVKLPLLSTFQRVYWSALPFFQATW